MTLQTKLTFGSVVLATVIVGAISAVDLGNIMALEFASTLEHAQLLRDVSTEYVSQALNRQRTLSLREALQERQLQTSLVNILAKSHAILEVAVVNRDGEILADSDPERISAVIPAYGDFERLVNRTGWNGRARLMMERDSQYYQLERSLGTPGEAPLLNVRVIIAPSLIFEDIRRSMLSHAVVSLLSLAAAVIITFIVSALAFRPLGRIGHMLDLAASGEFEAEPPPEPGQGADELAIMASKVSMLGQRLRGAQYEVSDLRGNMERLLQDLEDAVFIFNRELRLVFASGAVERLLGREREGLAGLAIGELFPGSTVLGLLIAQAYSSGRPVRNRRVPLAAPGDNTANAPVVLLSVDPIEGAPAAAGGGLLIRLRDPEAERKIGHQLQTADRLAAISRITGGVAHEVKNPLNAILLHVEVARARLERGDTNVGEQMEIIAREILRLDRVVKTFLDFTRPVELNLTNVPVEELMEEIAQLARPQAAGANIMVVARLEAEGLALRADRDLLKQALLNIVMNAIQAMPSGGELRLEALAAADGAEIRISDTGVGIPPELREKIFRLYFTTRKEGSGIGLAMTFRIVQLHDGTIDFTSEAGKGTAFSVRLPVAV